MGFDVFMEFFDLPSGEPLDPDVILAAVERANEEDRYHPVHRKGHIVLIGTEQDVRPHGGPQPYDDR